jgi:hypothetical protein
MNGYDARTDVTRWLDRVERRFDGFRVALRELRRKKCDPLRIAWLLKELGYANATEPLSRDTVRRIADSVAETTRRVLRLCRSQLNLTLSGDGLDLGDLHGQLGELAGRLRQLEPTVNRKHPLGRDLVRAALVHYVHETTGRFHDHHVSVLIDVTESLNGNPAAAYSKEAHTQWRTRAKALLSGPAPEIADLFDRMDTELE